MQIGLMGWSPKYTAGHLGLLAMRVAASAHRGRDGWLR